MSQTYETGIQISLLCPEMGLSEILFSATPESLVSDACQIAANEWDVVTDLFDISYDEKILQRNSKLVSHGIQCGSQLVVIITCVFGSTWFSDKEKINKMVQLNDIKNEEYLSLDTTTFANDGCLFFKPEWVSTSVSKIWFKHDMGSVTSISQQFLLKTIISSLKLSGFQNLTLISDDFLRDCSSLTHIDLSDMYNVTEIGSCFLKGCTSLLSTDISAFKQIEFFNDDFLDGCESLESFSCFGLENLKGIGNRFMAGCSSLKSIDLTDFKNVSTIGNNFLSGCESLDFIDVSPLANVMGISCIFGINFFMFGCGEVKLRGMENVRANRIVMNAISNTKSDTQFVY